MQVKSGNKKIEEWIQDHPLLENIIATQEVFWTNPGYKLFTEATAVRSLNEKDVRDAESRLIRFAPYIAKVFPETQRENGLIESSLVKIPEMQRSMEELYGQKISGSIYLKCDSHLPISGSVKARGGIYEVLKAAEGIAIKKGMLSLTDDYSILSEERFKSLFSQYSIVVGSTGNLGMSIGIMGAALGFKVIVHMSADAKQWKKDLLRAKGVTVIEHSTDYSLAVAAGRKQALSDSNSHFVDDENSVDLFLGYAVAAKRLKKQLDDLGVVVDENNPLFVYLPCGVGGGPGGLTFGLKLEFREHVHCFFAEPTHSPAMLIGLITGMHDKVAVQDFGIDNITEADGLAVGRPSGFVGRFLEHDISGVCTVQDEHMYILLKRLADTENIYLEPSALPGFAALNKLFASCAGVEYLHARSLIQKMSNAAHIVWATGGSMVPAEIMSHFYQKGLDELKKSHL